MRMFLLLLILIPASEIGLFILSGKSIGILPTVFFIILTGVGGVYLAKQQGLETIRRVQEHLYYGEMPGTALIDGICIFIGGILLLAPGFLTDIIGFLLVIPQTRPAFKRLLEKIFTRFINKGNITILR